MCGICGFVDRARHYGTLDLEAITERMTDAIQHRGPDDGEVWTDASAGVALGFRRLAIIDLSSEGDQPMRSSDGRYVIVFNGEIYNFPTLRQELEGRGCRFRGHSDTEVLLAAFVEWGVEAGLKRANGMFAFALWDTVKRELWLARDRAGEKPLYYGWIGDQFIFGSELKALTAHPDFRTEINRDALALFVRYNYIPVPHSIYQGIYKLPPGTLLTIDGDHADARPVAYWSAQAIAESGVAHPFDGTTEQAVDALDALLRDAVRLQMVADVPLGAFLSGGIDSSTVVALMQAQSSRPVKTFTIGLVEADHDEAPYAKAVAHHLGTDHTELYVTPQEALDVIPKLPTIYDEPFADSSQIPTYLVSRMARQHVTVSLSGDGGDELFAGYWRYSNWQAWWHRLNAIPAPLRTIGATALGALPRDGRRRFTRRLRTASEKLAIRYPHELYLLEMSCWRHPTDLVRLSSEPPSAYTDPAYGAHLPDFFSQMLYLDLTSYLPDDILTKVDRASMAVSLESRAPLLDYRVIEFAWKLPLSLKRRNEQGKWLLRQVLYRYVPPELVERPKMGFSIPLARWLRGPLREWGEALLDERRLRDEGFFDPALVRQRWEQHLSGQWDWNYALWTVLMFQAWLEHQRTAMPVLV